MTDGAVTRRPTLRHRAMAASIAGLVAATVVLWLRFGGRSNFSDFDQLWIASRALFARQDPYVVVPHYGYQRPLYYPLPAVVVAMPFSFAPMAIAHALFVGVGTAAFAYALTAFSWWPLLGVFGFTAVNALELGQWSLLASGIAGLPWLGWLAVVKPTTAGAVALAFTPATIRGRAFVVNVAVALLLVVVSFLILPTWLESWRNAIGGASHFFSPIRHPIGWILALALLRWRRPEARMLFLLACAPQSMALYEATPLALIAQTRMEALVLVIGGAIARVMLQRMEQFATLADALHANAPILLLCLYVPALIIILRRPNESAK